jgi:predicted dehydrogenase
MKFLIAGLGSMGKRRIRCLKSLGHADSITGFDTRKDRRDEAEARYHIQTISAFSPDVLENFDAMIVSVPPDQHNRYIEAAIDRKIPAFVEASVILEGLEDLARKAKERSVFIAPSCTLLFHPSIQDIKKILESNKYGRITNFSYHSGQYLPDWHPWEPVAGYYVSRKDTGGGREIVPFELTWIVDLMGFPEQIFGYFGRTMDVGAPIDDTYVIGMDFKTFFGNLTVDVVSRYATRSLILNLENAQILWNWSDREVKVFDAIGKRWITYRNPEGTSVEGYNKNIIDDMYIDELNAFITAIPDPKTFPNTLEKDIEVLRLLHRAEGKI